MEEALKIIGKQIEKVGRKVFFLGAAFLLYAGYSEYERYKMEREIEALKVWMRKQAEGENAAKE